MKTFLLLLISVLMAPALLIGQKIKLERLDNEAPSHLKADLDPGTQNQTLYPDRRAPYKQASYSTFWIFPDGNFNYLDFERNSNTLVNSSVTVGDGKDSIYCFLTEKYINTDPPEDDVYGITGINATTLLPQDNSDNRHQLNLYHNHDPRPGYDMVVAMSYNKNSSAEDLYLFYNNVGLDREGYDLFATSPRNILSAYYRKDGNISNITPAYPAHFHPLGNYKNAVHYNLATMKNTMPPAGINRNRIFSVLTTSASEGNSKYPYGEYANLVSTLTGKQPLTLSDQEIDLAEFLEIGTVTGGAIKLADNLYLLGIDTLRPPVAETHDPNELRLMKICHDKDNLVIDYELDICNDYPLPESNIDLTFTGINGYSISNVVISNPTGLPPVLHDYTWLYHPVMTLRFADHVEPQCSTVTFTVTIPFDGDLARAEQMLRDKAGFISYCVTFNSTKDKIKECDYKYIFNIEEDNYKIPLCPEQPVSTKFTWHWWYWLFIVIIVVPVIWKFFTKKKHEDD
jgi:hypothetical protein